MAKTPRTSRREFLKMGFAGIAGASILTRCSSNQTNPGNQAKDRKIVYRTLGRTGLRLPVVSMGSSYAIDLVRTALDEGIVYIHTSSGYSERNHERLLGDVFKDRPRDSFVIATAPELPYDFGGGDRSMDLGLKADPGLIQACIEGSLRRLKLEFVDIYFLLSIGRSETARHEPYMRAFEQLKKSGKTRFVGIGTHSNEPEIIRVAAESGFWDVVLTAYNFRQTHREDIREALRKAADAGLGVVDRDMVSFFVEEFVKMKSEAEEIMSCYQQPGPFSLGTPLVRTHLDFVRRRAKLYCQTTVAQLLIKDNVCNGTICVDESTGETFPLYGKAVILAAGGDAGLFSVNVHPECVSGDGYALGLKGGAEAMNLEFMQIFTMTTASSPLG